MARSNTKVAASTNQVATETSANDITKTDISAAGTNKSSAIRILLAAGYKRGPIAKHLSKVFGKEMPYQYVRNVEIQDLAKKSTAAG